MHFFLEKRQELFRSELEEEGPFRGNTIFPGWTFDKHKMCIKCFFERLIIFGDMNFCDFRFTNGDPPPPY